MYSYRFILSTFVSISPHARTQPNHDTRAKETRNWKRNALFELVFCRSFVIIISISMKITKIEIYGIAQCAVLWAVYPLANGEAFLIFVCSIGSVPGRDAMRHICLFLLFFSHIWDGHGGVRSERWTQRRFLSRLYVMCVYKMCKIH